MLSNSGLCFILFGEPYRQEYPLQKCVQQVASKPKKEIAITAQIGKFSNQSRVAPILGPSGSFG